MATKESHQLSNSNQAFLIYQDDNRTHKKFLLVRQEGNQSVKNASLDQRLDLALSATEVDTVL